MKRFVLIVGTFAVVIGLLKLAPMVRSAVKTDRAIKTEWGEPDLQGIWTNEAETPLQRPAQFAGREFLTDDEIAAIDARRARKLDHDYRAEQGTPNDVAGAYNAVFHMRKHTGRRTSLIVDPQDGRMPPFTREARERQAVWREYQLAVMQSSPACKNQEPACRGGKYGPPSPKFNDPAPIYPMGNVNRSDGPEDHGLLVRCLGGYMPAGGETAGFSSGGNGFTRRIVQTPGGISMFYDTGQGQSWQRPTIVMSGSPHLPSNIRLWWGDSRGHWEGNTLVIDVTNFTPKTEAFGARENLHLTERFTRTSPTTLEYVVTLEDPTTWTKPWTVKVEYTKQSEEANRIYTDNRCHEGNYGLPGLLRGARAEDKAFAEGRGPNPAEICTSACSEKLGASETEVGEDFAVQ